MCSLRGGKQGRVWRDGLKCVMIRHFSLLTWRDVRRDSAMVCFAMPLPYFCDIDCDDIR